MLALDIRRARQLVLGESSQRQTAVLNEDTSREHLRGLGPCGTYVAYRRLKGAIAQGIDLLRVLRSMCAAHTGSQNREEHLLL
ncbi:hypothetical protein ACIQV3_21370 [Streptomyces sp. NPDC099050]|uniref:hypothetical protein n=1 Tax=Streptomyces sp. NPDC099050 TaxID=3366100 RepID=UPI00381C0FE4